MRLRSYASIVFAALLLPIGVGCDSDPGYDHTYTTRGIIKSLPGEKATQEFIIHHETIPDYRSINGSVGMNEMMMPISVPDRSVLEGLEVGDKVELTFGERFEPRPAMEVIAVTKLPDDAELELSLSAKPQAAKEDDGFVSLFDGETLEGWEGDTNYWRVEDGAIVGEITEDRPLARNTFIIWRGGEVSDFELKFEYRIGKGGNSGVQYRSQELDNYDIKGYQADIHHGPKWTGINYDEHGRGILADRGQSVVVEAGEKPRVIKQFGDRDELMGSVDLEGWNEYHIIAKGNRLIHIINGVRMSEVVDNDETNIDLEGVLALQLHSGTPVKVAFRGIRLKQ